MMHLVLRAASVPVRMRPAALLAAAAARAPPIAGSAPRGPARALATTARTRQAAAADQPSPNDQFLTGNNAYYVEEMYRQWCEDPASVHGSWRAYFSGLKRGLRSEDAVVVPPTLGDASRLRLQLAMPSEQARVISDDLKAQLLVRSFQVRGHRLANLDPLGIGDRIATPEELTKEYYGFTEADLGKKVKVTPALFPHFTGSKTEMTIGELIGLCKKIYCGSIGYQYMHIPDRDRCDWLRARIEIPEPYKYSTEEKRRILDRLMWSDNFERFIAGSFPTDKRFGLEGGESLIPGVKALIDRLVDHGASSVTIGMPHRGRLNVLANVIRRPVEGILNQFKGADDGSDGGGDVKYHLGANYVRPTPSGRKVALSLVANPSHLEAEDPVVTGKTRALQDLAGDMDNKTSVALLMHGDAAFAGQGVVYETMGMYNLPNYSTGGTIHIIVNNQIGFTTDPRFSRSTPYPSDLAKAIDAPIFHVNGDDAEAVTFVCQLAADWRYKFKKDVVIDLVCYRRYGHNETDQPSFTQPRMYEAIAQKPTTLKIYAKELVKEGTFTQEQVDEHEKWVWNLLAESAIKAKSYNPGEREWLSSAWEGFPSPQELKEKILDHKETGVDQSLLEHIGRTVSTFPDGFKVHPNLGRILRNRLKTIETAKGLDMPTGEALAFGSLVKEGFYVRVSGQDVERGTFSQRHAVLHDQHDEKSYTPLEHIGAHQAAFKICNSSLSEYGALGFELGFSLVDPKNLTMWEAQFGDFANNAQCIIDQFIASGERKWLQRTGLVLSLPHGYDGQGPEHSSARIERFLQLCDDTPFHFPTPDEMNRQHQDCNMQLVYTTTPANYFHVLRRQVHRDFRKPLVHFMSKSLMRHPMARSELKDFLPGSGGFKKYIAEPHESEGSDALVDPERIRRHIVCAGQVYYELLKRRRDQGIQDVAISRLEQISPFPYDVLTPHLDKYPNADLTWVQEEPLNNGCWFYVGPRLRNAAVHSEYHRDTFVKCASRPPSSSVATGIKKHHLRELDNLLNDAFDPALAE